jgi:transposase
MGEYVGLDVSKEETAFCVKDGDGKVLARGKAASDPDALFEVLKERCLCPDRIVLETGTMSGWLARELGRLGLAVDVIDARQAHAVMKLQHNKTDAGDAELLAEIARTGFCRPVAVKSEAAQAERILLKARCHLVRQRRDTQNTIRGLLGSLGLRFPKGSGRLADRVRGALEDRPELWVTMAPLLCAAEAVNREIERLDGLLVAHTKSDPACRLLMSVPGVGPVTALAFVATIDDPERFAKSRAVGAYVGLTTRRFQSGEMDYSGRISKHGDAMVRSLLYEAANSMLTVVRKAHPLKDWARRIRKRSSHKKACVALARKLAVILHCMLITGELFRWPEKKDDATA